MTHVRTPSATAIGVYDHYEAIDEVKAYYGVLAIYGLARLGFRHQDDAVLGRVERILARFPDQIDHPRYNFPSYAVGGNALAYMVSSGRLQHRAADVSEYAEEMMTAARDGRGILELPNSPGGRIWIDVATAASPFLLFAGTALGRPAWIDEAVHQSVAMYDALLDDDTGLLHQCEGFIAPGVRSSDHWGRGQGWGILGLAELAAGLPVDHPRRPDVIARLRELSETLLPYQSGRGYWRQEVNEPTAWEELSGTGLIAYSLGLSIEAGILSPDRFAEPVRRAIEGIARHGVNPDFSTENSCPGTLCPGEGSEKGTPAAYIARKPYRDEVHSFAPVILAMSVAPVVGVGQVTLRDAPQSTTYLGQVAT